MEKYLTSVEVAFILGIRPQTLNKWRLEGKGPKFFRNGRYIRYRRQDVDAWVQQAGANADE